MVEHVFSVCEAVGSSPNTTHKQNLSCKDVISLERKHINSDEKCLGSSVLFL